ncbi:MAG: DNA-directed RNA polymerase subunit H [Thermoplasmata archaeon]|nr:DNA-directed RNA polymerase subunit H [Thermoplasmata archaeon]
MDHDMVPEHQLLSEEEAEKVLEELGMSREQLPKIKKKDPCVLLLERVHGEIPVGSVIRIIRKSLTAGETVAYRTVVAETLKEARDSQYILSIER